MARVVEIKSPEILKHEFRDKDHVPFVVGFIPCSKKIPNWSLDQLSTSNWTYSDALEKVLSELGVKRIVLPGTREGNARIHTVGRFITKIHLTNLTVWTNKQEPADGAILLEAGHAIAISSGGCPLIVATRGNSMVAAHASERSLFNYSLLANGYHPPARPNDSVVESILDALQVPSGEEMGAKDVHVWVFYSIDSLRFFHSLDNREHGEYNFALSCLLEEKPYHVGECLVKWERNIHLNLPGIISRQFISLGVPWTNINLDHSTLPIDDFLYPTTRAVDSADKKRRYLLVAVRL